ncbi:MAG: 3-methyl-2-oxobutanoate hydroxymethyltransferase [Terrimicrobiaceae bacterium]|nr:3-methyl-2-oxobutanoate hydroxymethyltransferase [Terrimicrobiaceae bacterium]
MKKPADFLRHLKQTGQKLASLTAYDYPTARVLDECGLDFLLVGDSLGMVVLGYPDTTSVTMDHMLHHTAAVARGATHTWIVSDLPIGSYANAAMAAENALRLRDAGADAVKMEGGHRDALEAISSAGVPLVGHLGMLPQRVREEGGYRIKGREQAEADRIRSDARFLDELGASAVVLELVHRPIAAELARELSIPTIGIGSGPDCDGQILVLHDVIGAFPWFRPKFASPLADVAGVIQEAATKFVSETRRPSANGDR